MAKKRLGKKPQLNVQLEFEEKETLDAISAACGETEPREIVRAFIKLIIRRYRENGALPLTWHISGEVPLTELSSIPQNQEVFPESPKLPRTGVGGRNP